MLDRAWIEAHIPHKGAMCLLDRVVQSDAVNIVCQTASHRLESNPLRVAGSLGIANAIEYAAQAIAVHGALQAAKDEVPGSGYLAAVRDVQWFCQRLDDIAGDLTIKALRLSGNQINVLYSFEILTGEALLITGRILVMLNADVSTNRPQTANSSRPI